MSEAYNLGVEVGQLKQAVKNIAETIDRQTKANDDRHRDNVALFGSIDSRLETIEFKVAKLWAIRVRILTVAGALIAASGELVKHMDTVIAFGWHFVVSSLPLP